VLLGVRPAEARIICPGKPLMLPGAGDDQMAEPRCSLTARHSESTGPRCGGGSSKTEAQRDSFEYLGISMVSIWSEPPELYRDIPTRIGILAHLHVPGVEHRLVTKHTWVDLHSEIGWPRGR
jgi:hypothetical protein